MNLNKDLNKHYTDSMYYELVLTVKYYRMFFQQLAEDLEITLSMEELTALDVLSCNSGICQRDLAKILLKDRANTGRILSSLEGRGYITRTLVTRNNYSIRQINLTEDGKRCIREISDKLRPKLLQTDDGTLTGAEREVVSNYLERLRKLMGSMIKTQI